MKRSSRESKLYPIVERWLRRYHHCFKTAINTGLRYSRIDVVGVRDVGGDLSGEVETISIEVKRGTEPFATASGQASGYKVYANRVYLADARSGQFSPDEIDIASHLGIGLIQVTGRRCKEVLSSPYYKPVSKLNFLLLERLYLGQCQMCNCFFDTGEFETRRWYSNLAQNIKKAIVSEKGLMFWNHIVGKRKQERRKFLYERRFICPNCIDYIRYWREQLTKD